MVEACLVVLQLRDCALCERVRGDDCARQVAHVSVPEAGVIRRLHIDDSVVARSSPVARAGNGGEVTRPSSHCHGCRSVGKESGKICRRLCHLARVRLGVEVALQGKKEDDKYNS